jgi:hypothetical protein
MLTRRSKSNGKFIGMVVCYCDVSTALKARESLFRGSGWWEGRVEFSSRCIKQDHIHSGKMNKKE